MKFILIPLFILITLQLNGQDNPKTVNATRTNSAPKIDGILNELAWTNADVAKDFSMWRPDSGNPERENNHTEVKVIYDDEAIYFGAYLYDDDPKSIPMEFGGRDEFGHADWFAIILNPDNDKQNDTEFFIKSTGAQADAKASPFNEDFGWNAVWESEVKVVNDGWIIEVKIPYAALRFSNQEVQTWGINFHRRYQDLQEQYSWNFIDKTKGVIQQYGGLLLGIENIEPPTRLSFSPYSFGSVESFEENTDFNYSLGMDLKYGISESFTLDATLIPDFGQTAFDDEILNLGPLEQQYDEKRSFFTEGTELFNKGNLFYSRRIGNSPTRSITSGDLNENESFLDNPSDVNLINAIKVSGRTKKGLGVGVFNAITEKTTARIKNSQTDDVRKEVLEPLSNYNVLVLDQQFNENSSVSFVNTSVLRNGEFRDANVTGLLFNIVNKKNTHFIDGSFKMSHINEFGETNNGFFGDMSLGNSAGNHTYEIGMSVEDREYDINDLGFNTNNNTKRIYGRYAYRIFKPTDKLNNFRFRIYGRLNYLYEPNTYTGNNVNLNYNAENKKNFNFGGNVNLNLGKQYEYYFRSTVADEHFYLDSSNMSLNHWIGTNRNKKFSTLSMFYYSFRLGESRSYFEYDLSPKYRITDKISVNYSFNIGIGKNEKGFVATTDDESIIFGNRDVKNITNTLS
jgi:hypothetical protein